MRSETTLEEQVVLEMAPATGAQEQGKAQYVPALSVSERTWIGTSLISRLEQAGPCFVDPEVS